jgi:hypothetical protein
MAYSKAKLKSSGDKASPCFRPFWIEKLSDKCLPIRTLLFKININLRKRICFNHQKTEREKYKGTAENYVEIKIMEK